MKHYIKTFVFTILILLNTVPSFAQRKYFSVGFQQDGQIAPVENHQVILKKKAFTILLYFKQPESVLVNASFYPESFKQAQAGRPFKDIPGFSDLGMAEEPFNPKSLLMLSSTAPHYWYFIDDSNHRFNNISQKDGVLVCHRIIGQVMYRDTTKAVRPIRDITENELYLVFMRTEWAQDFSQQFEKQRDYVKVIFR